MSYPTFHEFCGDPDQSNITVTGTNGLPLFEINKLVECLNTQPDVDTVAKAIAFHRMHRGKETNVELAWSQLPEKTKDMWRETATQLLTTFFVRVAL